MTRTAFLPPVDSWDAWRPIFTDAAMWNPVIGAICRAHAAAGAASVRAGFPGTCAVFVVDEAVVVKLFPPMVWDDFVKERMVYAWLEGRLPQMPRLLGHGLYRDRIDWPYLLLEFRRGTAMRDLFDALSYTERLVLARELGDMLRTVHATPVTAVHPFLPWSTFLAERRRACLVELRARVSFPDGLWAEIEAFLAQMVPRLATERPLLLHADLTEDHLLLVRRDGRWQINALLDWADAEVGAAAYDWVALWFSLCRRDANLLRAVLQAYDPARQLNENLQQAMLACTFLHRFGPLIIADTLSALGQPPLATLAELRRALWF